VKVIIRNPQRKEFQLEGHRQVGKLLRELGLNAESHIVIRDGQLLTRDDLVREAETVEILSAISGGDIALH
jgi:sulfur carrier protein